MTNSAKRILSILVAVIMLLGVFPLAALAEDFKSRSSAAEESKVTSDAPADANEGTRDSEELHNEGEPVETEPAETEPITDEPEEPEESEEPEPVYEIADYNEFLEDLAVLETYAEAYAREHDDEEKAALVINYIRTGVEKYNSGTWNAFCGEEKVAFTAYVAEQDEANSTSAGDLKNLSVFILPNGDLAEFNHMFGCMDMAYHTGNQETADLGSWAGDICDLVQLTHNAGISGTVEEMAELIRTDNEHYFLYDDPMAHSFGIRDFYGDLDSFYIIKQMKDHNSLCDIMEHYYTPALNDAFRSLFFINNRLGGVHTKAEIRSAVYRIYTSNEGIRTLEGTYLPDGVNADLRRACCYAFADHIYEMAKACLENPYYSVFSSETSNPAPGITQEIKMAMTQDDKQIVYYLAISDISRDDVMVCANYANNDPSEWQMARVSDQMAAAQSNHSDPESDRYIPYYNVVVGTNADFYNMASGKPTGALVMEGVVYQGVGSENFFGILDDGTAIIGGKTEWDAVKDHIVEAVGANIYLVRNGRIDISSNTNYYSSRASRTCVGITYDGRVVMMVLDGRQEPFSCGGANIEIAQIMLDAGCVTAVNLDGGGSTTFAAKAEGSNDIVIVNRPSDGYERSVSSSLMVVSTAKPTYVFDHAVVSAEYDYLTVGTSIEIKTSGVTPNGGSIELPEGTYLALSDDTIGSLDCNTFTALALGDVLVKLFDADGNIVGKKTLHVVEPTEIRFQRETMNAIYSETVTMPLEAVYNGNAVKINPNDVRFGYIKISLVPIATVEGGEVNTTRTQLVYEYPEAGTMNGFEFTASDGDSGLRTLTIGAVLSSKMDDFEATIGAEYQRVYSEAINNGFTQQDAALQAEEAAVNLALSTAAKILVYFYSADEAEFDFDSATGGDELLAWRREVSNAEYDPVENTYQIIDPSKDIEIEYTFAVDMSKVPIPEKLTGLLFMLPGGDQEGRTAWQFMLQLAERISNLTTVSIQVDLPEGFEVDYSEVVIANEYFEEKSIYVEDGKLYLVCNFISQSEPVNPTSANPLCVLSGLKLRPADDSVWDGNNLAAFELSGSLSYDIYAHFHSLMNLANQEEYQEQYGLFPYDNRENDPNDYGAHFANDNVLSFDDSFILDRTVKNGWIWSEAGWSYYQDGRVLTGIHKLPGYNDDDTDEYWFDLGDGISTGKLTGIFEYEGEHYFARVGVIQTGWQSVADENGESWFYFFDRNTGVMYTGVREVDTLVYTFNDGGQLIRGAFRTNEYGTKYFVAGKSWFRRFVTLEEGTYWLNEDGYVAYGNAFTCTTNVKDITWYHFDEETGLLDHVCSGFIYYRGELYYCDENGKVFYGAIGVDGGIIYTATRGKVYVNMSCYIGSGTQQINCSLETGKYLCAADGFIVSDGFAETDDGTYYFTDYVRAKGFKKIGEDYYLFNVSSGKMYRDTNMWVGTNDYGVAVGMHYFGEDGRMFIPDLENGVRLIIEENGYLYFTIDGVKMTNGLNELDGEYYYSLPSGRLVTGSSYWVSQKNGLIPEKGNWYYFGEDGKMLKTGFVVGGDGSTYYYDDTVIALGFTKIGDDYYFFNAGCGKMYRNTDLWVGTNSYGVTPGTYHFNDDGKMFVPDLVNGEKVMVEENGNLYLYIDGVRVKNGLYEYEGDYYYAQGNGVLAVNKTVWVSNKNGLIPEKGNWYAFDSEGRIVRTGFVTGGGATYYYDELVLALGFTKIGEDYYFFNAGSGKMYCDANLWVGANSYGIATGMHYFGADGRMSAD
jgi:exopolysaccharide biosynthesis protein/glucan-binding YG repeat protein